MAKDEEYHQFCEECKTMLIANVRLEVCPMCGEKVDIPNEIKRITIE
jgi:DNA-directed RNA polymerase subunit M/transcription elongation factor TFIIS